MGFFALAPDQGVTKQQRGILPSAKRGSQWSKGSSIGWAGNEERMAKGSQPEPKQHSQRAPEMPHI